MDNDACQTGEEIIELNKAHIAYQELLTDEIKSLFGIAMVHGWSSTRQGEGIKARNRIAQAQLKLGLDVSYTT